MEQVWYVNYETISTNDHYIIGNFNYTLFNTTADENYLFVQWAK